jgi:nucleoid DNA-binding protein
MAKKLVKKAAAASPKIAPASKVRSKSEVYGTIADQTGLPRKQVVQVFDTMQSMIEKDLSPKGPGVFQVPGMMKVTVVRKPATKARKGINPFTKEEVMFKAKPARNVVKIRPLKGLKALV